MGLLLISVLAKRNEMKHQHSLPIRVATAKKHTHTLNAIHSTFITNNNDPLGGH